MHNALRDEHLRSFEYFDARGCCFRAPNRRPTLLRLSVQERLPQKVGVQE